MHGFEELPAGLRGVLDDYLDHLAVEAFVAEHVAPHKKVRAVEFIDVIPKSVSGKILRKELRGR